MGFYDTIILTITNGVFIMYKVTYASDSLDPNPTIKFFNFHHDGRLDSRGGFLPCPMVCGSQSNSISEKELEELEELEFSLVNHEWIDGDTYQNNVVDAQ
jgi:hypothetical protein